MRRPLFCLALIACAISCSDPHRDVLILLPDAKNVERSHVRGMDVLEYQVNVKYPSRKEIAQIDQKLKSLGWKPVPYNYLYPKVSSSHTVGWTYFDDPPKQPNSVIYEWAGDWLDSQGNLVTYTFRYRDPYEKYQQSTFVLKPAHDRMEVSAIFTPSSVAGRKQKMLNP